MQDGGSQYESEGESEGEPEGERERVCLCHCGWAAGGRGVGWLCLSVDQRRELAVCALCVCVWLGMQVNACRIMRAG
jgi:hypothetical protein